MGIDIAMYACTRDSKFMLQETYIHNCKHNSECKQNPYMFLDVWTLKFILSKRTAMVKPPNIV